MPIEHGGTVAVSVDQSNATAEGHIAGRDIYNITNNLSERSAPRAAGIVEQLLQRLDEELKNDQRAQNTIEKLQRYHRNKALDGVVGLEAKLKYAGREANYYDAIEMKEMFVKLLHQWSLYASAQQIFVYLLARAERHFNDIILPQIPVLGVAQVNSLVNELIVEPTVSECGASVFEIDHNTALGMVYWLAEQCFVRWHK
ncbi:ABC-three component system protein [Bradyrhizobium sp. WSM1417]|uniref:ABC-three component system protein n=1 Tax=Bradyrhizobium sp. WSM1417 TaxID=754500 RepID=UPI0004869561|nr:ABC-three component system protein [Bradyrhizobium sp. WSM1417]